MFFESVTIENFKAIDRMQITFQPGINLLIGDNGAGKTAVLEALIVALGGFLAGAKGISVQGIHQTDVRFEKINLAGASSGIRYFCPTSVEAEFCMENEKFSCARIRNDETGASKTRTSAKKLSAYAAKLLNDPEAKLPLLGYHSTARVTQFRREDFGTASRNKLDDRRCGYIGCLDSSKDIKSIREWCLKMEMAAYHKQKKIPEYEEFKATVADFMYQMNDLKELPEIYYSRQFEELVYVERGVEIPVKYLSAGYQSLLWMVMDMSFRLALLNPENSRAADAEGIILIDEIDMHLHPKWQWKVLDVLSRSFPKVQFIAATHSPIIIASCKEARLIQLENSRQVTYLPDAYAYSVEDVLEFRQGSGGILRELRQLYDEFEVALNEEDDEKAERILKEMTERFGEDNTEVKNARAELELG